MANSKDLIVKPAMVKRLTLDWAKQTRHQPFRRVSDEMPVWLDGEVRRMIKLAVQHAPSMGKTIYPPVRQSKD